MKKTSLFLVIAIVCCSALAAQSSDTFAIAPSASLSDSIVNFGKIYLNTRYRSGGMTEKGFDCSGFTSFVYQNFGYTLPRSSSSQAAKYMGIKKEELQRGDLVFFNGRKRGKNIGHVGIVTDANEDGTFYFIHSTDKGVLVSHSEENYYVKRYMGAGHVIEYSAPILAQKPEIKQEAVASTNMVEKITNIEYTVKRGETLTGIAKKYEISVADLKAANDMTTNKISPLQKLIIPYKTLTFIVETENQATQQEETSPQDEKAQRTQNVLSKIDAAFAKPTPQAPTQQTYTVQKGDTFYSLARKYGCTVEKLKEWNHKEDDYLKIGENIVIGENKD